MKYLIFTLVSIAVIWTACDLIPAIAPDDWAYHPPEQDSIVQDTIIEDTIEPCIPQLYDQPQFVTGYWYIPFTILADQLQVCVYPNCFIVPVGTDVTEQLLQLLEDFNPSFEYEVYVNDDHHQSIVFIAKGTNNKQLFNGKVWIRPLTVMSGWGFECNAQSFFFFDALSFDEYLTAIDSLPSVDKFTFQYTNWDSIQYIEAFNKILDCRIGRSYADLRYLPFTFPDSVYAKFDAAGWDTVLN